MKDINFWKEYLNWIMLGAAISCVFMVVFLPLLFLCLFAWIIVNSIVILHFLIFPVFYITFSKKNV